MCFFIADVIMKYESDSHLQPGAGVLKLEEKERDGGHVLGTQCSYLSSTHYHGNELIKITLCCGMRETARV